MNAREEVLARIRSANASAARPIAEVPRDYAATGTRTPGTSEAVDLLEDRLVDYKATVTHAAAGAATAAISSALGTAQRVVVPPGLPVAWRPDLVECVVDDGLSAAELDRVDAAVTAATVACAVTGTIVLDGSPDQGRRAISLVPDRLVCVVRTDQIVETVPEMLARLEPTRPLTFISGPSATSDIELDRVEGVHGPRTLHVVLVAAET
ncbi:MAG: LUD domain-containing protein [Nocardioidaceae bacterium]|nr:LUD domain-containing protein [Nocardioidaceae bacterium]